MWSLQMKANATGLFAATVTGLIALNLRTLEATTLAKEDILTVAVNHNLRKLYWSENRVNCRIMRSNFDGSAREVIVPPTATGDYIFPLAIDEASGNLYFGHWLSHEITVCSALGINCTAVVSNSSFVNQPIGIALDSDNGFLYWGNRKSGLNSLVRANLDGSSATIISTGFSDIFGITLQQPSNDLLYWVDYRENTIGTIDINGGNKRTLLELEGGTGPFGIQFDSHKIYVGNTGSNNIQSVDRNSGKQLTTIFNSTSAVRHLALFNAPVKQS